MLKLGQTSPHSVSCPQMEDCAASVLQPLRLLPSNPNRHDLFGIRVGDVLRKRQCENSTRSAAGAGGGRTASATQATRTNMKTMHKKLPKPNYTDVASDPRWARIVARDRAADGHLWYSVVTTGVFCRPSCPSRLANPKNVQLHDSLESAKATGFRPCLRCHPDGLSIEAENSAL